jgi:hypothetical protein
LTRTAESIFLENPMCRFASGDMWSAYDGADLFLFTSNGVVTGSTRLVMGAGIALSVRDSFPGIDRVFGEEILKRIIDSADKDIYGLLVHSDWPDTKIGAFQVKRHFRDNADIGVINYSILMLKQWCEEHPTAQVHLNFPGIGYGGLKAQESKIEELLQQLPDTVTVWRFK